MIIKGGYFRNIRKGIFSNRVNGENQMKKKALFAIISITLFGQQELLAENISHSIDLSATVNAFCSLGDPDMSNAGAFGANGTTFVVGIDGLNTTLTDGTITFPDASCNAASQLEITRSGLTTTVTPAGDGTFQTEIPYTLTFNWGTAELTLMAGQTHTPESVGPTAQAATIGLNVQANYGPLAEGSYSDTITIVISPIG